MNARPEPPGLPHWTYAGAPRFRARALLGQGRLGLVYHAHDEHTGQDVALKTLPVLEPEPLYHLKEEFRALAGMAHPNLVELYELVVEGSQCFFTMELLHGRPFTEHPWAGADWSPGRGPIPPPALAALCAALEQLALGVTALHREGRLHRDIKPSNVLVTEGARVVLLDFDLVVRFRPGDPREPDDFAGTPEYMAPEQIWSRPLTPAADWYSLGVLLHEALSGQLPFTGPLHDLLHDKQQGPARPLRHLVPDLPPDLDALVADLLHPDPARRPDAAAILSVARRLARLPTAPPPPRDASALVAPFIGRAAERAALRAAHHRAAAGAPVIAWIEGASGMGKTELVRRFLQDLDAERLPQRPILLSAACHPQETIPYKAFDGIVDTLSRYLLALSPERIAELLPDPPHVLTRLFPILARVPALSPPAHLDPVPDPQELRARAFRALRALLARLTARHPVVVFIDDLQWGDADSAALFRELLRPPDPPPILWILASRAEERDPSPLLRALRDSDELRATYLEPIHLDPLAPSEREDLAAALLAAARIPDPPRPADLIDESAGSPLFLTEMVRHLAEDPPSSAPPFPPAHRLQRILRDRIDRLPDEPRRLLEIVAVAGRPLDRALALRAAGMGEAGRRDVARLSHAHLLRPTELDDRPAVVTYHERIREAVLSDLPPDRLRAHHATLADHLRAASGADPEALLEHTLGAGDLLAARHHAIEAAARAARALAFDRAATHYRTALALHPVDAPRWPLTIHLADALANAGRAWDAARTYEEAAQEIDTAPPTPTASPLPADPLDLRRLAAEHYLRSGHFTEGRAALTHVLAALRVPYPPTPAHAWAMTFRDRLRLRRRGLHFAPCPPATWSPLDLARADACWSAGLGLAWIDRIRTAAFQTRYLQLALDTGEPTRAARALATEASQLACLGGADNRRRAADLLARAEHLAHSVDDPELHAFLHLMEGTLAFYNAEWSRALHACRRAQAQYRDRRRGFAWEMTTAHLLSLPAQLYLGDLAPLRDHLPQLLHEAADRGDRLAAASLATGLGNLIWLAADDPHEARRRADQAISLWSQRDFQVQHYFDLLAQTHIDLYEANPHAAWRRLLHAWPRLHTSFSLHVQNFRVTLVHLRARVALVAAAQYDPAPSRPAHFPRAARAFWLQLVAHDIRRLASEDVAWAAPLAAGLDAGHRAAAGRLADAAHAFDRAAALYTRLDMPLHASAARHQAARLRGGESGRAASEAEARWMRARGVVRPDRLSDLLMPGPTW